MNAKITFCMAVAVALMSGAALADWNEGDPYKMHWPQLPDPFGWDVSFTNTPLGDDWLCTETGPVSDIHMWVSFRGDVVPSPEGVVAGWVEIWSDVPPDGAGFSHPGQPLWGMSFDTNMPNVRMRLYAEGPQGWLDPYGQTNAPPDHFLTWQINIDPVGIPDGIPPFVQQEGEVYWLVSQLFVFDPAAPVMPEIGWKTALPPQFRDDAVYSAPLEPGWWPLEDPFSGQSLDLAFVITPEPSTLALVGAGGLMMLLRRRTT